MPYPIKVCVVCSHEFELKPDKPGFANRCPACSDEEAEEPSGTQNSPYDRRADSEVNEARRRAMRDLLYDKDS